jgi:type IV pilus assembly protein PilF
MKKITMKQSAAAACLFVFGVLGVSGCMTNSEKPLSKPEPERAAEINLEIGLDHFRKGNLPQAKEKIERALEQNPRNPKAHITAGMLYDRLGQRDRAEVHFSKGVQLDPENPEIKNTYGAYLCQNGKYARGEKLALEAAANPLYRTPEIAYLNAANCARNKGDLKSTEQSLRKALAVRPKFGDALFQMADLSYEKTDYLAARGFLERYLAVGRTNAASLWLGVRIERGLGNAEAAREYAERLKLEYPRAAQTKALLESERNPG